MGVGGSEWDGVGEAVVGERRGDEQGRAGTSMDEQGRPGTSRDDQGLHGP